MEDVEAQSDEAWPRSEFGVHELPLVPAIADLTTHHLAHLGRTVRMEG